MRKALCLLLLTPTLVFGQVPTKDLTPIVRFTSEEIKLKDTHGNQYALKTDCKVVVDNITEFTVNARFIRKGTEIRFSKNQVCKVEYISASA